MTTGLQHRNEHRLRGKRGRRFFGTNRFEGIGHEAKRQNDRYGTAHEATILTEKINSIVTQQTLKSGTPNKSNLKLTLSSGFLSSSLLHPNLNEQTTAVSDHFLRTNRQLQELEESQSIKDVIIAGMLIALTVVLMVIFVFLVFDPLVTFFRRKFGKFVGEDKTLVERRYKTIDKWLIQKTVQAHDDTCRNIRNYKRLKTGESSLEKCTDCVLFEGPSLPLTERQIQNCPSPLRLTPSFDTNTTQDFSCSSSDGGEYDVDEIDYSVQIYSITRNGNATNAQSPKGFEIECLDYKQQSSTDTSPPRSPTLDIKSYNENIEMVASSFVLTRKQVFDKLEITKSIKENTSNVGRKSTCNESDEENFNEQFHLQECSICMEVFKVGDKVSFSPAKGCFHVFHHDCLRRWLLRKTDCPCCRVIMLPVDRPNPKANCDETCDESSPQIGISQTISDGDRLGNPRATRRQLFRLRPSKDKRPWYHKNPTVIHERLNKKCGTFCCVACGVVTLNKNLREDLSPKVGSATKCKTNAQIHL